MMKRYSRFCIQSIIVLFATVATGAGAAVGIIASSTDKDPALVAFATVKKVLQDPRCQNCHIPGDAPLQFDTSQTHAQNVKRGSDGHGAVGLTCNTCHGASNPPASYGAHVPPGAPDWHLPPPDRKQVFIGRSGSEICRTLKDKTSNGGKDLAGLLKHVSEDKLVLWGWDPGVGRAPVAVPHAQFVAAFKQWTDAGGPCPTS